ncbi:MAG: hypothetical protein ACPLPS_08410 [bacterium]
MRRIHLYLFLLTLLYILASCGGGGGTVSKQPAPPAPTNFNATRKWVKSDNSLSQKVELIWDAVAGAKSYKIYRQTEEQSSPSFLAEVSSTSYIDNLTSDLFALDIDYFVSAVVNDVEGEKAKASTSAPPPPSPF